MKKEEPMGHLLNELARLFRVCVHHEAAKRGISGTYFYILNYLYHQQEKDITQSDICQFSRLKAPTISITLQSMESEGLLERVKTGNDNRKTFVKLTKKGIKKSQSLVEVFNKYDDLLVSSLTEEELDGFYESAEKMSKLLREQVK